MRSKKKKSLFVKVLVNLLIIVLCFFLGIFIDSKIMVGEDGVPGHGMPFFTIMAPALAVFISVIRIFVGLIQMVVRDNRDRKKNI